MNEAELGFELKNALARIEALETALREITEICDNATDVAWFITIHLVALTALTPEQGR